MKLLGRIVVLFAFAVNLFSAQAFLSKKSIVMGDSIVLIIRASGNGNIEFPDISSIGGFDVTSSGMQQSIEYINGKTSKTIEKQYVFMPTKSIDIKPFEVTVDGKKELTNSLHVNVQMADNTNSPFTLKMVIKKTNVMQFEAVPIEFIFTRDESIDVRDLRFSPPKFENFWVKNGKKIPTESKNGITIHKMQFFIYPQKAGDFELAPSRIDVGVMSQNRDIFNMLRNQLNWKTIFSNKVSLHVKKLEGTNLYGNFNIKLNVDKNIIDASKGVNATLKITGSGNFDDIEAFKLDIKDTNIYADKPKVQNFAQRDKLNGEFMQKFSISSQKDFIIPSVSLTYYDSNLKKLVTKKTQAIRIKVKNSTLEKDVVIKPKIQDKVIVQKENSTYLELSIAFIVGILATIIIGAILYFIKKKEYKFPKFKSNKDLLKILLQYRGKDKEIDKHIEILEENLYAKAKHKVDIKSIKKLIKFYEE